jgi:hypothetical protein
MHPRPKADTFGPLVPNCLIFILYWLILDKNNKKPGIDQPAQQAKLQSKETIPLAWNIRKRKAQAVSFLMFCKGESPPESGSCIW